MNRGINKVIISGSVDSDVSYHTTNSRTKCATFHIISERRGLRVNESVTSRIKINLYSDALVEICQSRLKPGKYLIVEGELMTRDSARGEMTEVRAKELVFVD